MFEANTCSTGSENLRTTFSNEALTTDTVGAVLSSTTLNLVSAFTVLKLLKSSVPSAVRVCSPSVKALDNLMITEFKFV